MSISHLSLVNQKLAYASSLVTLVNTFISDTQTGSKLQQQALADAAVFHLSLALKFYLRELAEQHHIKNISAINSAQDLAEVLQQADRVSSESSELSWLLQTSGTWLNQLAHYYDQLSKSPEKTKEKKAFGNENLIKLVELTELEGLPVLQLTPELLTAWLGSFRAMVIRQRETSAEY